MISVASLENSRRLFKVSEWKDTEFRWKAYHISAGIPNGYELSNFKRSRIDQFTIPAYDLSFLVDKLPNNMTLQVKGDYGDIPISIKFFVWFDADNKWRAGYRYNLAPKGTVFDDLFIYADTPVDAACLLAINLFETNILKKGVD